MATIALALNLADRVLANSYVPLAHELLDWIRPGYFLIFALTVASLVNRRPALLAVLLSLAFILAFQDIRHDLVAQAVPVAAGVGVARVVLAIANEYDEEA